MSGEVMSEIIVLTDGQCRFCKASMDWVAKRLEVQAIAYQSAELSQYGLSYEQCAQQVYVISEGSTYGGAEAIAFLLKKRGNRALSAVITISGGLGRTGYRWIASHRISWPVKFATKVLIFLNR